ncbi:integrase [Pandoraea aquatica]|uniref:Integrase n=2 Tax=Pandoraea aquatica TaxID=2508290 RepID=A0A5E4UPS2_9BURK|nr:integrase [Pandoraea aquatica]
MPRERDARNKGLPTRWRHIGNAYYYQVPPGLESMWDDKKTFRLGSSLPEAYRVWADRLGDLENIRTMDKLLDRYTREVLPTKAVTTQAQNASAVKALKPVFGRMPLNSIKPRHVYQYIDKREAKVSARREIEVLSHALTKAVEWGYIDRHPFKGELRLASIPPRTRYVEDWEVLECFSLTSKRKAGSVLAIQAYIRVKLLTGLRRGDLLRLRLDDLQEDGIHVMPAKTANSTRKQLIIEWTDALREAVDEAKAVRPWKRSEWLFCTQRGDSFLNEKTGRAGSWDSMWQGFMRRVLAETKLTNRFTEHDLRAKCASDAESLTHAQTLLAHADSRLTARVYRRKPERVKPLR